MERYISQLQYVNATRMTQDFVLTNLDHTFMGQVGDYLITDGKQHYVIPEQIFDKLFKKTSIREDLLQVDYREAYGKVY
ncbi:hypothetical protein [Brevibacillus laterosporus]|uniref:hypothetical protein n=1 Tax=Brevibacillus laterosporus TaxID=1465 RepID=UPI000CE3FEBD|nr:hypothetical protein [Brevibacillus laterosporus]MED1665634.1 hypothetical protein [Brevibacillus laterosporus]MED1667277.1 hypothetical protein [Brevibacillus laterosporus]MED1719655.1 hypothetical protein [Brevibacillus laterosporus]PPA87672.1 hypothetical protein C4A75_00180 [Brevibacillus laterosporus]